MEALWGYLGALRGSAGVSGISERMMMMIAESDLERMIE